MRIGLPAARFSMSAAFDQTASRSTKANGGWMPRKTCS
jgi:hypothetical protein